MSVCIAWLNLVSNDHADTAYCTVNIYGRQGDIRVFTRT